MGNGNSCAIRINLDRVNSFYFTDEIISGTARLHVAEGKIRADKIFIMLIGEIGYTTTQTVSNGDDQTTIQIQYHDIPFHSAKIILVRPKLGQKELVFSQGQYSWPFQIPLTNQLPPSINEPHLYPHVKYYLQVVIDKPWYRPNTKETKYLTVYPCVNLLENPQCLSSSIFENQNRKDITLKCTLNKTGYVPGEIINIKLEIENPRKVLIQRIDISMLQSYRIGQGSHDNNVFQTTLPNIMCSKDEQIEETHNITIPSIKLPPSYQFQSETQKFPFVNNYYKLRFTAIVEGMFTNFHVDVPITLGTETNLN
jgi:hypothetical protein